MKIRIRMAGKVNVLDIEGKIDINSIQIIEIIGELLKYKKIDILCNFRNVEHLDYNGLSILTIAYKNVINRNGKMKFCNVPVHILGLFKVAHLDSTFEIYNNEKTALKSFNESTSQIEKRLLRRRFKRLYIHVDLKYSILARPKKHYKGRLINVSGTGVYIQTKNNFPVKTKLNLTIKFPAAAKAMDALGMVVWQADREIQPQAYPGMGIQFIDISSGMQKRILGFIDRNITHRSGKGLYTE